MNIKEYSLNNNITIEKIFKIFKIYGRNIVDENFILSGEDIINLETYSLIEPMTIQEYSVSNNITTDNVCKIMRAFGINNVNENYMLSNDDIINLKLYLLEYPNLYNTTSANTVNTSSSSNHHSSNKKHITYGKEKETITEPPVATENLITDNPEPVSNDSTHSSQNTVYDDTSEQEYISTNMTGAQFMYDPIKFEEAKQYAIDARMAAFNSRSLLYKITSLPTPSRVNCSSLSGAVSNLRDVFDNSLPSICKVYLEWEESLAGCVQQQSSFESEYSDIIVAIADIEQKLKELGPTAGRLGIETGNMQKSEILNEEKELLLKRKAELEAQLGIETVDEEKWYESLWNSIIDLS